MTSGIIICPHCLEKGKKRILGSVDNEGFFIVKRFQYEVTIVKPAGDYAVICVCGFGTTVDNTKEGHAHPYNIPLE